MARSERDLHARLEALHEAAVSHSAVPQAASDEYREERKKRAEAAALGAVEYETRPPAEPGHGPAAAEA